MDDQSSFSFPPDICKLILYQLDPIDAQICMQVNKFAVILFTKHLKGLHKLEKAFDHWQILGKIIQIPVNLYLQERLILSSYGDVDLKDPNKIASRFEFNDKFPDNIFPNEFSCFSTLSPHEFKHKGRKWKSVQHYFQV
jgi:hypothetical protein